VFVQLLCREGVQHQASLFSYLNLEEENTHVIRMFKTLVLLPAVVCFTNNISPVFKPLLASPLSSSPRRSTMTLKMAKSSTPNTMVECDSDMENCVDVPRCNEIECRTTLDCRVDNVWYDLSGWRKGHPGGEHWIDYYDGRDATEVMYAFHSDKAMKMMQKLPKSDSETVNVLESIVGEDSSTAINFRKLREVRLHNDLLLLVCEKRNNFFDFNPLRRTTRALSTTTESLKGWVVGTGHCS